MRHTGRRFLSLLGVPVMRRLPLVLTLLLLPVSVARAGEAEDKAVAFVKKLGGSVERDEKKAGKPVVVVNLHDLDIDETVLKELARFKQLRSLVLEGTNISDAGL